MSNVKDFGLELMRMMGAADMTQVELSRLSGVHQSSICNYIQGMNVPTMRTLQKLDQALPGLLFAWGNDVAEYQRQIRAKSIEAMRRAPKPNHYKRRGPMVDKPRSAGKWTPPSRSGPLGSLAQVCREARAAGMTYGQYVARHSVERKG